MQLVEFTRNVTIRKIRGKLCDPPPKKSQSLLLKDLSFMFTWPGYVCVCVCKKKKKGGGDHRDEGNACAGKRKKINYMEMQLQGCVFENS